MEVRNPPVLIDFCPPVQLALDPEYPLLGHLGPRPRRDAIQRRPPRLPDERCKSAALLRQVTGFPGLGLLRRLRPTQEPTADSEPAHKRAAQDGSHVHRRPIDGGGAQLFPCSLAMSTPQTFLMASAPATKFRCRSRPPDRTGVHCCSAHIRQVGADAALKGVPATGSLSLHLPVSLAEPGPSGSTGPSRRCRGRSHPHPALPRPDCPSFNDPLRRAAVGSLTPLGHSTPRGALRARGTVGPVARAAIDNVGLAAHRAKFRAAHTCVLPEKAPVPTPWTLSAPPDRTGGLPPDTTISCSITLVL